MKYSSFLAAAFAAAVAARSVETSPQTVLEDGSKVERYLIELEPGETMWITEDQKWELRRVSTFESIDNSMLIRSRKESTSWTSPTLLFLEP